MLLGFLRNINYPYYVRDKALIQKLYYSEYRGILIGKYSLVTLVVKTIIKQWSLNSNKKEKEKQLLNFVYCDIMYDCSSSMKPYQLSSRVSRHFMYNNLFYCHRYCHIIEPSTLLPWITYWFIPKSMRLVWQRKLLLWLILISWGNSILWSQCKIKGAYHTAMRFKEVSGKQRIHIKQTYKKNYTQSSTAQRLSLWFRYKGSNIQSRGLEKSKLSASDEETNKKSNKLTHM